MARRPKPIQQLTAAQFDAMLPDEEACCDYLVGRRWPDGVKCPRCGADVTALKGRPWRWQCYNCAPQTSYRFSHLAGTIFENTNKPLRDWFKVVHLMTVSKKGISALQVMHYMGFGSYKTAWLMCHKVRTALIEDIKKLSGIVEVDETYVGGKDKNRHWDKRSGTRGRGYDPRRTPVIGAVKRKGNVVACVVFGIDTTTVDEFVQEAISKKVSLLCTDALSVYDHLEEYPHGAVDHQAGQHVIGAVHTNTIEGFWSLIKRGMGIYHKVSAKYLPLYVAEFQFRYNNRANAEIFGVAISGC